MDVERALQQGGGVHTSQPSPKYSMVSTIVFARPSDDSDICATRSMASGIASGMVSRQGLHGVGEGLSISIAS